MHIRYVWVLAALTLLLTTAIAAQGEKPAALTVEAKLCTGVADRMPVGEATAFAADVGQVYLWTKIVGASGAVTVKHVWMHDGKEVATVDLPVTTAAYRTWSAKKVPSSWTGNWEVKVVGPDGATLTTVSFTVGEKTAGQ